MLSLTLCSAWEKMGINPVEPWKEQIQCYSDNDYFSKRILIVFKCQNSSLDYIDTVKKFIEKMMERSKLLMNARKSNPTIQDIGQTK